MADEITGITNSVRASTHFAGLDDFQASINMALPQETRGEQPPVQHGTLNALGGYDKVAKAAEKPSVIYLMLLSPIS